MTDNEIIRILPTQPPHEVLKAAMECPELHPSFISFKRVSVETGQTEWQELMTPEDFDRAKKSKKTPLGRTVQLHILRRKLLYRMAQSPRHERAAYVHRRR